MFKIIKITSFDDVISLVAGARVYPDRVDLVTPVTLEVSAPIDTMLATALTELFAVFYITHIIFNKTDESQYHIYGVDFKSIVTQDTLSHVTVVGEQNSPVVGMVLQAMRDTESSVTRLVFGSNAFSQEYHATYLAKVVGGLSHLEIDGDALSVQALRMVLGNAVDEFNDRKKDGFLGDFSLHSLTLRNRAVDNKTATLLVYFFVMMHLDHLALLNCSIPGSVYKYLGDHLLCSRRGLVTLDFSGSTPMEVLNSAVYWGTVAKCCEPMQRLVIPNGGIFSVLSVSSRSVSPEVRALSDSADDATSTDSASTSTSPVSSSEMDASEEIVLRDSALASPPSPASSPSSEETERNAKPPISLISCLKRCNPYLH